MGDRPFNESAGCKTLKKAVAAVLNEYHYTLRETKTRKSIWNNIFSLDIDSKGGVLYIELVEVLTKSMESESLGVFNIDF